MSDNTGFNNNDGYFLKSERIGFRAWKETDLELAFEIWGDKEVSKFVGGPFTRDQVRARLMKEIGNFNSYRIQYWPMFLIATGEHIGCCGLKPYSGENNILETGFYLKRKYQGAGYAKEAAAAVINYAFDILGVSGLFAGHHPDNKASGSLLKKLGFENTGVEFYEPTGLNHPAYMLTRDKFIEIYIKQNSKKSASSGIHENVGNTDNTVNKGNIRNAGNTENLKNSGNKTDGKTSGLLDELKSSKYCCEKAFSAIKTIIDTGSDFDCYKINAFRVAEAAGVGRPEMLRAFLFAVKLGLFDLNWDIHCPSCRGIPEYHKHLMGLKNTAHCDLCAIDWDLDLEEQLEATFTVNPNIRKTEYLDWSERAEFQSKMEFLDDILAREKRKFTVGECVFPDKPLEAAGDFSPGLYYYYMPSHVEKGGYLEVSETPPPEGGQKFSITVSREGEMLEKKLSAGRGRIGFTVTSNYPYMNGFLVTPVAPRTNWVSAAYVTAQQDFRDLFSGEFLSPGLSFAVKNVTLMFTDITGSTALYEAIGDAGAYSAVHEHFGVMIEIIRKYEGGVVKTIGDAVMASFPVNANAVRAACEIQRLFSSGAVRGGEIKVKIGVHRGPAIAVTSNRNLDFFGRSVNVAARVQGKSAENEVLFTQPVVSDPEVERYFLENKFKPEQRPVSLKGIAAPLRVYSVNFKK